MATPLAWRNLTHNRLRTAVGVAGVGFAAMLIFMQMGFRGAIERTATQIYDALQFDLMLRSPAYLHLTEPRSFPRQRLLQTRALPEVAAARPMWIALSEWQTPPAASPGEAHSAAAPLPQADAAIGESSQPVAAPIQPPGGAASAQQGLGRGILVLGVDPLDPPFARDRPDLRRAASLLTSPGFVLIDSRSKPEYGPRRGGEFSKADIGVRTALGPNRVTVVGLFELGSGMVCNGASMANPTGFRAACPFHPAGEVNLGLITLAPGAELNAAAATLRDALAGSDDVEVLTREQVRRYEEDRWMVETPFGAIFSLGVLVSILVGVAIVYQVLSTDIANLRSEYATLKAIGYGNNYLSSVVLRQSLLLAVVAYTPSLLVAYILYHLIGQSAGIPMVLTPAIMLRVLLLTITMCLVSGAAALRKLFTADPASLF